MNHDDAAKDVCYESPNYLFTSTHSGILINDVITKLGIKEMKRRIYGKTSSLSHSLRALDINGIVNFIVSFVVSVDENEQQCRYPNTGRSNFSAVTAFAQGSMLIAHPQDALSREGERESKYRCLFLYKPKDNRVVRINKLMPLSAETPHSAYEYMRHNQCTNAVIIRHGSTKTGTTDPKNFDGKNKDDEK
uniref:DNA-directed RNA polymerase n=1 Tax=Steinernema glaseri TaxID=37863 RepID=A0A1I7Y711_9BILA